MTSLQAFEIVGAKHIDGLRLRGRLRPHGAELRVGSPLESQSLCRFKEVLRDLLAEKGVVEADVIHDQPRVSEGW